ncbi:RNA-binding protein [Mycolicibacterium bacteremicum]|uniref:RNA-binding protein n=1 Tax=Mycolicibacterium bacteremicum TaxID=564198 RepID=A0A1W9YZ76_MYCBA|nr:RNA-binding protein [Mycolicibacterium bacteremicum]ORA05344.1 RNA-binding protein [Mycolicibacterium bacteremicum]
MALTRLLVGVAVVAGALGVAPMPTAGATVCGSVGGFHVNVSGCTDPLGYLDSALPPPAYVPPPPAPNVNVCANFGRRISVSGCV